MDLAPTHEVLMAGRTVGEIPIDIRGWQGRADVPGALVGVGAHPHRADEAGPQGPGRDAPGQGRPVDPAEGEGHPAGGCRAHLPDHGSRGRPAPERGRRGARRRERDLVHRLREGLRLDRPARPGLVRPARRASAVQWSASPASTCWARSSSTCSTRTRWAGSARTRRTSSSTSTGSRPDGRHASGPVEVGVAARVVGSRPWATRRRTRSSPSSSARSSRCCC